LDKDVELSVRDIHSAFDEKDDKPEITDFGNVNRLRLMTALIKKYGDGFIQHPRAMKAMKAFDGQMNFIQQLRRIKGGKNA
jgi:hypothetical protein